MIHRLVCQIHKTITQNLNNQISLIKLKTFKSVLKEYHHNKMGIVFLILITDILKKSNHFLFTEFFFFEDPVEGLLIISSLLLRE